MDAQEARRLLGLPEELPASAFEGELCTAEDGSQFKVSFQDSNIEENPKGTCSLSFWSVVPDQVLTARTSIEAAGVQVCIVNLAGDPVKTSSFSMQNTLGNLTASFQTPSKLCTFLDLDGMKLHNAEQLKDHELLTIQIFESCLIFQVMYERCDATISYSFRGKDDKVLLGFAFLHECERDNIGRVLDVTRQGDHDALQSGLQELSTYTGVQKEALGCLLESILPMGDGHSCNVQQYEQRMEREERKAKEAGAEKEAIEEITSVFIPYDSDSSGCVSTDDFQKACHTLGEQWESSPEDVQNMISDGLGKFLTENGSVDYKRLAQDHVRCEDCHRFACICDGIDFE